MNTEIRNSILTTNKDAQYDECAKKLLSQKSILAHILVRTVDEFKGMNPKDVIACIERIPFINTVPVDPGLTNTVKEKDGARIVGFNTENQELHEGTIRFDIIFYVRMRDGLSQIIINIEAQKDEPSEYDILNRAIFYVSRMISSQKERDFTNSNYNDIKRVYSIWVCMKMSENSLVHIHLVRDNLINSHEWKGKLDLINIVMIGLTETLPKCEEKYELHRLLGTLLFQNLTANEKLDIIGNEYDIPLEKEIREDVSIMCNLSAGIREAATKIATEATSRKFVLSMYKKGYTIAQIADVAEMDEKKIEDIIKESEVLVV